MRDAWRERAASSTWSLDTLARRSAAETARHSTFFIRMVFMDLKKTGLKRTECKIRVATGNHFVAGQTGAGTS
jgi:predicted ABC-type ATPase